MATSIKPSPQSKTGQSSLLSGPPKSQAALLDKLNRRSTPDSEALASSEDEGDMHRQEPTPTVAQPPKPVRRASWLNDTSQASIRPRQGSFASGTMSPTTSHPTTPSADAGVGSWGAHSTPSATVLNRAHAASGSFTWGNTGIWNTERKEMPSRLTEVLPSPTSTVPSGTGVSPFFPGDTPLGTAQPSPVVREQGQNQQIPFAIPLHPTPKTYRSQSYSVGQMEHDSNSAQTVGGVSAFGGRSRPIPHSGLQHRPSRPSMLSEMSSELGKVKEVEDDEEEGTTQPTTSTQQSAVEKQIEMLTRENAMLRANASQQYHSSRIRPRASTAATYAIGNGYTMHEAVPEESDYAVDEDDGQDLSGKRNIARRMSEFSGAGGSAGMYRPAYALENRKLESVKKASWQSSLGFGGIGDISQSRRHSFADIPIPTRQGSISSLAETANSHDLTSQDAQQPQDSYISPYSEQNAFSPVSSTYFTGGPNVGMPQQAANSIMGTTHSHGFTNPYAPAYAMHSQFANRSASPHRGMYGMSQPSRNTPLHVVLFKCARADVFYIQEGTGLTVKEGDLVIVEADRGTDLGTVAITNVDWNEAKRLKEHYAEEQYKWLMMYSQNARAAEEDGGAGLMAASNGMHGSTVGGMGPPGQHHMQEPTTGELKPKLIKRLAQNHEVHSLRDKEGNEAKAKRVCMQKVKEHGLNMEILDAEFQMDWKKLTFYYFADSYINFNSLVTDLFKIYKTRIWMSAINPASFATQPLGLQAPSGIGPGAVGVARATALPDRRPNSSQEPASIAPTYPAAATAGRPFQGNPGAPFGNNRVNPSAGGHNTQPFSYAPSYNGFGTGNVPRAPGMPYGADLAQGPEAYGAFPQAPEYQGLRSRYPNPQAGMLHHEQGMAPHVAQDPWVGTFQSLSLNSG